MLVFVRNTELRGGKWEEIDFQAATWTIPAERMKHEKTAPKPPHVIPLADWSLELLAELREITGHTPYLFPSRTKTDGFISENTLGNPPTFEIEICGSYDKAKTCEVLHAVGWLRKAENGRWQHQRKRNGTASRYYVLKNEAPPETEE